MNMKRIASAAAAALIGLASPAVAAPVIVDLTGSMPDNGTYGDVVKSPVASDGTQVQVTGWQFNQSTGVVTSAYVGMYSPGLGVTGLGDDNGANNYHQIDNAGGYTDFVLLQFNRPVDITTVTLNSFLLGNATTKDNDLAIYTVNLPQTTWNGSVNLAGMTTTSLQTSQWKTLNGTGTDGPVATGITTTSSQWLIGAAFNSGNNDGFKIQSLTLAPASAPVPEPATWLTLILGMGMVGTAMRRRSATATATAAA